MTRVHVIGAGLSGLAAAVELVDAGREVTVYDQAGNAGGRCRSFQDAEIGRTIDNGNHLVLSGNRAIARYLQRIGATDQFTGPERAEFPFLDLVSGERWTVRPGAGRIPWWILSSRRRIPGTRLSEYAAVVRLATAPASATVADCLVDRGTLFRRFWDPLTVSALNTRPEEAAARLLWPVLRETFGKGEAACRPRLAINGLNDSLVEPALSYLRRHGASLRFHVRLRSLQFAQGRVCGLSFAGGASVPVLAGEAVVLAVPPPAARALLPKLTTPTESRAIVNAHFGLAVPVAAPSFLGLTGGVSHWLFQRDDVASVTVSAADDLAEQSNEQIVEVLWPEVRRALAFPNPSPRAVRIIKEKRATFAQTPAQMARRPACHTASPNLFLAGDWTDTGLPATLEGSVRSGHTAAAAVLTASSKA